MFACDLRVIKDINNNNYCFNNIKDALIWHYKTTRIQTDCPVIYIKQIIWQKKHLPEIEKTETPKIREIPIPYDTLRWINRLEKFALH